MGKSGRETSFLHYIVIQQNLTTLIKGINPRVEPWTRISDADHRGTEVYELGSQFNNVKIKLG